MSSADVAPASVSLSAISNDAQVQPSPLEDLPVVEASESSSGLKRTEATGSLIAVLAATVVVAMVSEVLLLCDESVPWLVDKLYLCISLVVQAAMVAIIHPRALGLTPGLRARLLDVCHWIFVVMIFAAPLVMRAWESLAFVTALVIMSLVLRLSLRNTCIMTSVADDMTSLPNISGRRVTVMFTVLLVLAVGRTCLQAYFGSGFPFEQIANAWFGTKVSSVAFSKIKDRLHVFV